MQAMMFGEAPKWDDIVQELKQPERWVLCFMGRGSSLTELNGV